MRTNVSEPLKIALLGCGTVGSAVAAALLDRSRPELQLKTILHRAPERKRAELGQAAAAIEWTTDMDAVLGGDSDVVVELMGGREPATAWIEAALRAGKSVVTANKQIIAREGARLARVAAEHGAFLLHGGAVAGGVPVLAGIAGGLLGDRLRRVSGILNGTCNYILTRMETGTLYTEALADAQRLGYAEADPTEDVGGLDARAKLCILSRVAMRAELAIDTVEVQTIAAVDAVDFAYARELGSTVRQVSRAELTNEGVYARVAPMLVPLDSPMAWSHGTQNMVVTTGELGGDVVFSGHGAGGRATAAAVLSDLIVLGRGGQTPVPAAEPHTVTSESVAPHYLRFVIDDRPGVVAVIATGLARAGINIDALLQRPGYTKERLPFVITTEPCHTGAVAEAVRSFASIDALIVPPLVLERLVVDDRDEATA